MDQLEIIERLVAKKLELEAQTQLLLQLLGFYVEGPQTVKLSELKGVEASIKVEEGKIYIA